MTRLIDADALKSLTIWVTDDEGIDRPVVKLTDIDAAPTVSCGECANYRVCYCIFKDGLRVESDACSDCFERRTP